MLKGSTKALIFVVVIVGVIALLWKQQGAGGLRSQVLTSGDTASPTATLTVTNIAMKQNDTYMSISALPPNPHNFEARSADSIVFSWNTEHADSISFTQKTIPSGCPDSIAASEKSLDDIVDSSSGKSKIVLPDFADAPAGCTITNEVTVTAKNNTNGETATDSFQAVVKK